MMFPKLHDHIVTAPDAVITGDELTSTNVNIVIKVSGSRMTLEDIEKRCMQLYQSPIHVDGSWLSVMKNLNQKLSLWRNFTIVISVITNQDEGQM